MWNITTIPKWYIANDVQENEASKFFIIPLRFLLLNSSMIPISLKVTLEVCKVFYSLFIDNDEKLYTFCAFMSVVIPLPYSDVMRIGMSIATVVA